MAIALNFYVGILYARLIQLGTIKQTGRMSWKKFQSNLSQTSEPNERNEILKCFNLYKAYLTFLYFSLFLIALQLFQIAA
jgi:hypothetical protein